MSCTCIRDQLPLLLYDDLPPDEAVAVQKHLASCPSCQREYAALEQLRRTLDAGPAPAAAVNLPALYQEAARRQQRQVRHWRRAAGTLLAAATGLLVALVLNLEVRVEAHQLSVRWGAPLPAAAPPPPPAPAVEGPPSPVTAEDVQLALDLIHALAQDVKARDRQQQKEVDQLRDRLDAFQRQADDRWTATQRNEAALYTALFGPRDKGGKP